MRNTTHIQPEEALEFGPEQLAKMSEMELLEFVRRYPSPLAKQTEIDHDHRQFLHRDELIRLAYLVHEQHRR